MGFQGNRGSAVGLSTRAVRLGSDEIDGEGKDRWRTRSAKKRKAPVATPRKTGGEERAWKSAEISEAMSETRREIGLDSTKPSLCHTPWKPASRVRKCAIEGGEFKSKAKISIPSKSNAAHRLFHFPAMLPVLHHAGGYLSTTFV
ncbi:hypothetical protein CK203_034543 [Vitis vinifera]|uniref:Uncharacterized protein n=1 Tax=Vitis vinifera TaxID=29760 RepID=A0A438IEJ8_VITVI|nr:hypothetical protein CK203_034543 [Vitis vinifera]